MALRIVRRRLKNTASITEVTLFKNAYELAEIWDEVRSTLERRGDDLIVALRQSELSRLDYLSNQLVVDLGKRLTPDERSRHAFEVA